MKNEKELLPKTICYKSRIGGGRNRMDFILCNLFTLLCLTISIFFIWQSRAARHLKFRRYGYLFLAAATGLFFYGIFNFLQMLTR